MAFYEVGGLDGIDVEPIHSHAIAERGKAKQFMEGLLCLDIL